MKNKKGYIGWIAVLLLLAGCGGWQPTSDEVEETLTHAGGNRGELFRVIEHYRNEGDSLKLKAALFLIGNMKDKIFLSGEYINRYYRFIDSVYQIKQQEYDIPAIHQAFIRQYGKPKESPAVCYDAQHLSAGYLIRNIEEAFAVWNKPWNRHLSFEDFCEWILPYRVRTEQPEAWRAMFGERYAGRLDTDSVHTAKEACTAINNELIKLPIHLALGSVMPAALRPSTLANIKFGLCEDYADLAVYSMRALGIPVAEEIVPHWGRGNGGHVFNVVYDNDGTFHDFSGAEQNPDEHFIRFKNEIPKVYRTTFGRQAASLAMQCGDEKIPLFFRNPYLADATGDYAFIEARDITVSLPEETDRHFAYLCVFDPKGWTHVAWGKVSGKEAGFQKVGPNIVYHAALFENDSLRLVGNPFLLDTLGHISYYVPQETTMKYVLERKFRKSKALEYLPPLMIGCQFQGADNPDFRQAETFHTIASEPDFKYMTVDVHSKHAVKYVRYRSSDQTWGNMAEVEFYADGSDVPLKGKVIGGYIPSIYYPRNGAEMLFDGDPLTFFHSTDSLSWGGLALERPERITKIRYIIRNDDNGIRKGHEYELFYMNHGVWTSLGKKQATEDDKLLYENLPKGALFWLHDYTKGKEERIFEIINGKVIWH